VKKSFNNNVTIVQQIVKKGFNNLSTID